VTGGAQLVVKPEIATPEQLSGKNIATPALANTQDVALKKFIAEKKLGDVKITTMDNPKTFDAFRKGELDGGWLPEPWASRLVLEAGAKVLVDEKDLWKDGKFPTTVVLVRSEFLQQHPETVRAILKGELAAIEWARANPAEAKTVVNEELKALAGSTLSPAVLDRSFSAIELGIDPVAVTFPQLAQDSVTAGVVRSAVDLKGFADFGPLNSVLKEQGKPGADASGLTK
jgi:NitT/TauT family transport system substrate-binding protein